jgi:hypothetical protein
MKDAERLKCLALSFEERKDRGVRFSLNLGLARFERLDTSTSQVIINPKAACEHIHTRPHEASFMFIDLLCANALDLAPAPIPDIERGAAIATIERELLDRPRGEIIILPPRIERCERREERERLPRDAMPALVLASTRKLRIRCVPRDHRIIDTA